MVTTSLAIKPASVHVWQAWIPDFLPQVEIFYNLLSPEEQKRAANFHFPLHRQRFIIARAILRSLLSCYLQISPKDCQILVGKQGKPYLHGNPIFFNLSHSEEMVVYGVSADDEVGIDIEKITESKHFNLATRFFNKLENEYLNKLDEKNKHLAFYQFWTAKEAALKLLGQGLYMPISEFIIDLYQEKQTVFSIHKNELTYFLKFFKTQPDYMASLTTFFEPIAIIYGKWSEKGPVF